MEFLRKASAVFVGALGGAWIGKAIFDWILDAEGAVLLIGWSVCVLVGLAVGISEARDLPPMQRRERSDAIIGWGGLIGGAAALICLFAAPMPWAVLGAVAIAGATFVGIRATTHTPAGR